jgi:hypothetical protein
MLALREAIADSGFVPSTRENATGLCILKAIRAPSKEGE